MSDIAIKVENLGKLYRLGEVGTGTISHDLNRWWAKVRGKEDPFAKIGETNDRTAKGNSDYVWSLKEVNFEVKQGEVLGIIGRNGAGKSTLLKLLSKVTTPTTGRIKVKGRIASLLEVGTGFHPELTGRENIFLNGAILGMTKVEIRSKFDEIVAFSGVERYVDTPVKRYSSGMYVRLAFAVAAHLEPEILIVDEVLAVGDAEFQKKAIGKMQDISKGEGRTVLFVSHNMSAVKSLCNSGLVLRNGESVFSGNVYEALKFYQGSNEFAKSKRGVSEFKNENINILEFRVKPSKGEFLDVDSGINVFIRFMNFKKDINLGCTFELVNKEEVIVFHKGVQITTNKNSLMGEYTVQFVIPPFLLNAGNYKFNMIFGESQKYLLFKADELISFELENTQTGQGNNMNILPGIIRPNFDFNVKFLG
ncbi:MAG: ABC transporter ATP-binding protein [Cytophagales bacterium CG18_big_fil_WC_8_21_14_2_50_42_9]|nr:MAG: ABC transporter ATP-binding protein [Cytophagales bacterium CG18_big_fil_WC_8_21_14_2_50_42_9]